MPPPMPQLSTPQLSHFLWYQILEASVETLKKDWRTWAWIALPVFLVSAFQALSATLGMYGVPHVPSRGESTDIFLLLLTPMAYFRAAHVTLRGTLPSFWHSFGTRAYWRCFLYWLLLSAGLSLSFLGVVFFGGVMGSTGRDMLRFGSIALFLPIMGVFWCVFYLNVRLSILLPAVSLLLERPIRTTWRLTKGHFLQLGILMALNWLLLWAVVPLMQCLVSTLEVICWTQAFKLLISRQDEHVISAEHGLSQERAISEEAIP